MRSSNINLDLVPSEKSKENSGTLTPFENSNLSMEKWITEVDGSTFEDWQKRSVRLGKNL